jgi:glucose/mannose transport system permease protein
MATPTSVTLPVEAAPAAVELAEVKPAAARRVRTWRRPRTLGEWTVLAVLTVFAAICLVPLYVMVTAGLKTAAGAGVQHMWSPPSTLSMSGFTQAWQALRANLGNSFLVVVPATVISCLIGSLNGFVFSKMRFRGANLIFNIVLIGMFIPYQSILIPLVRFLASVGLYGTLPGLILTHIVYGIPITTLIFRNYYSGLPKALMEAAQIDGASTMQIFRRIVLPLSVPGFIVTGLFQFTNIWNDFLFGLVIVPDPSKQVATVALNNLSGSLSVNWNVVMAGALIAAVPTVLIYLLLGRYFVRGLMAGSVK